MTQPNAYPVIAIDGPSASGKGSVAQLVADYFGFCYLDSGAIYRLMAFAAHQAKVAWSDEAALVALSARLNIAFRGDEIWLNQHNVTEAIRSEQMGKGASEVAVHPQLRLALLNTQKQFRQAPGLVADGRDMGSVVFPDAQLKVYLTAAVETRAQRRYQQLMQRGQHADYTVILDDLQQRDRRDQQRAAAPLTQVAEALLLDTTHMGIQQAVDLIVLAYKKTL